MLRNLAIFRKQDWYFALYVSQFLNFTAIVFDVLAIPKFVRLQVEKKFFEFNKLSSSLLIFTFIISIQAHAASMKYGMKGKENKSLMC